MTALIEGLKQALNDFESGEDDGAAIAKNLIRGRRERDRMFRSGLFADPAWDMLLELYIAHHSGRTLYVSSLCMAAAVPDTTALRWIATLEREGLLTRIPDEKDLRRIWIKLTDEAIERVERCLRAF